MRVTNYWPIRTAVFVAPAIIIVLMMGAIAGFGMALNQLQTAYDSALRRPITRATTATRLLLDVSDAQAAVLHYAQLRRRSAADDALLQNLRPTIFAYYGEIDKTLESLRNEAGMSDVVTNIDRSLALHRVDSTHIISGGAGEATVAEHTIIAHYQQLQGYIAQLTERSLESADLSVEMTEQATSQLSKALTLGSAVAILLSMGIAVYTGRAISRVIGVFNTVTQELREHERTLDEARLAAESANAAKSDLLANVSHELRTPLTSILGFTQLIKRRLDQVIRPQVISRDGKVHSALREVDKNIDIILSEGGRLTALINNVLEREKIEAGETVQWNIAPTDVSDVLEHAAEATRPLYTCKGIGLKTRVDADVLTVMADRDKLMQVLVNLISNAVKFSERGDIVCSARMRTLDTVEFSVADRGRGMATEDQGPAFERFRQVGNTLADKPSGTGLGLAICRDIVAHLGGDIWVESEPGVGSIFRFYLPVPIAENRGVTITGVIFP